MIRKFMVPSIIFLTLLLSAISCPDSYENGPEITWTSGSSLSYSYSGGALSGFTANIKFVVTGEESGEIEVTAKLGDESKSCVSFVESGNTYSIRIPCMISKDGTTGSVIISCPSLAEDTKPYAINSEYKMVIQSVSISD
jgi:hypothetical protein